MSRVVCSLPLICVTLLALSGCKPGSGPKDDAGSSSVDASKSTTATLVPQNETDIVLFCGDCHAMPLASSFPKDAWRDEILRGFGFYYASGRSDLTVPLAADVQRYFVSQAPQKLSLANPQPIDSHWAQKFDKVNIALPGVISPAISFIDWVDSKSPLGTGLVVSEMRGGGIFFVSQSTDGTWQTPIQIGRVNNPAVVRFSDWDNDGLLDFLVADLGSFLPADHDLGKVVWFRQLPESPGSYQEVILQQGVGRVSSLEVVDLNGDDQNDLLVAEFGWQTTGSIFSLMRLVNPPDSDKGASSISLEKQTIDSRSGTIHLPVVDLNNDGAPDFIALISQHHERIEAMINDGKGHFEKQLLYAAEDPSFGSSGIQLSDVNNDGRIDVIHTNGDSFDSFILKPFHGVRWLENQGTYPFQVHELGPLPGVHRGVSGDMNSDGLKDIVAGVFLPQDLLLSNRYDQAEAMVLWTQEPTGDFSRHVLSAGDCMHASIHIADVNEDSRDDLVVGYFREPSSSDTTALTIWTNRR